MSENRNAPDNEAPLSSEPTIAIKGERIFFVEFKDSINGIQVKLIGMTPKREVAVIAEQAGLLVSHAYTMYRHLTNREIIVMDKNQRGETILNNDTRTLFEAAAFELARAIQEEGRIEDTIPWEKYKIHERMRGLLSGYEQFSHLTGLISDPKPKIYYGKNHGKK